MFKKIKDFIKGSLAGRELSRRLRTGFYLQSRLFRDEESGEEITRILFVKTTSRCYAEKVVNEYMASIGEDLISEEHLMTFDDLVLNNLKLK